MRQQTDALRSSENWWTRAKQLGNGKSKKWVLVSIVKSDLKSIVNLSVLSGPTALKSIKNVIASVSENKIKKGWVRLTMLSR